MINIATSVRVIVICIDSTLLWRVSYNGVDLALAPPESELHQIIILKQLFVQPLLMNFLAKTKLLEEIIRASD